ncbi:MAG: hypothetical protein QM692_03965 [Thermomicrobiales bacterium]
MRRAVVTVLLLLVVLTGVEAALAQSTRDEPVAFGAPVLVGDWAIRVSRVNFDAASIVRKTNQFNDPPAPGQRFVMALIDATYLGEASANLVWDTSFKVVGQSNSAYATSDPGCGVLPRAMLDAPEAFTGGRITANVCWSVPESDIASLVMFAEPLWGGGEREFLALSPAGAAHSGTLDAPFEMPATRRQIADARRAAGRDRRVGGRHNPIPFGQAATVGDWTLRVTSVNRDAEDLVLAENMFNDPPPPGQQFLLVGIDAQLAPGADNSSFFWTDISLKVVGPRALAYSQSNAECGVTPAQLTDAPEVFPGGRIQGNACWAARSTEIEGMVLLAEPLFGGSDEEAVFFALS